MADVLHQRQPAGRQLARRGGKRFIRFGEVGGDLRFPKTGRRVQNKIDASFSFRDGLIVHHRDSFDFYRWSRMALGPVGAALGWSPIVKNQVRAQAAAQLRRFQAGGSAAAG